MSRFHPYLGAALLLACACGGNTAQTPAEVKDESWWQGHDGNGTGEEAGRADLGPADAIAPEASSPDVPSPVNAPPTIGNLNPVSLDQGKGTTLDLNPFIDDDADPDSALALSWHAKEVAIQDPGNHVLYVVAPTTWFGAEMIPITVTDTEGLEATAELKVIVQEVDVPEPLPPVECPKTAFSLDAGKDAKVVLLSGNFNNWGDDDQTADVMTDPDADGVFTVEIELSPGSYLYKFIVDGSWKVDPENANRADDGYGGKNSVVNVPECGQ